MKAEVKLFGTFGQDFPGYQHAQGMEVEIPDGTTARDILALLQISESRGGVVVVGGRVLKADDKIEGGATVHVLQALHGG